MIYFLNHQKLKHICLNLEKNTIFIYVAQVGSQKYVRMLKKSPCILFNSQIWLNHFMVITTLATSQK